MVAPADNDIKLPAKSAAAVLLLEYSNKFFSKAKRNSGSLDFEYILERAVARKDDIFG